MTTPTTRAIRAWRALERPPDQRCVQWAAAFLAAGTDTPALRKLARLTGPLEYYEATRLIDRALAELGVPPATEDQAITAYVAELLDDLLLGRHPLRATLGELTRLCIDTDYDDGLMPFYKLGLALDDLDAMGIQFYWDGADRHNIESITHEQARRWIAAHPAG